MRTRLFGPAFLFCIVAIGNCGCLHTQLRYNTVSQAETLTAIYERQVLNNLAMFVDNPHALPHFAVANLGTLNVTDSGQFSVPVLDQFRHTFGLQGGRQMFEGWQLDPVRDPKRLTLMRCAYQRAVGCFGDTCIDCCELEKEWRGKPDKTVHVYDRDAKHFVPDPDTGEPYDLVTADGSQIFDDNGHLTSAGDMAVDKNGNVIVPQLDCNGPCSITSGWYCYGCYKDVPKVCRATVGCYHGTYVWVPPEHRDHLTRLTLAIIDYATNDPAKPETKEVVRYLDANGDPATVAEHAQAVKVTVPADAATDVARSVADIDSEIARLSRDKKNLITFLGSYSRIAEIDKKLKDQTDEAEIQRLKSEKKDLSDKIAAQREALSLKEDEAQLKDRVALLGKQIESLKRAKDRVRSNFKPTSARTSPPSVMGTRLLLNGLAPQSPPALRP